MRATNERLTILSEAEQAALYQIPDFDDVQRLNYLNLTPEEQELMRSRANLAAQVHCAIQMALLNKSMVLYYFTTPSIYSTMPYISVENTHLQISDKTYYH